MGCALHGGRSVIDGATGGTSEVRSNIGCGIFTRKHICGGTVTGSSAS